MSQTSSRQQQRTDERSSSISGGSPVSTPVSTGAGLSAKPDAADSNLIAALSGLDAGRGRAVANRTRRAVHQAAADIREGRELQRRDLGIALLTLAGFLLLLTPAIWNSIDELLGGEFLFDMPGIVAALVFTLFAAVAAVLFLLGGQGERSLRHSRR